MHPTNDVGFSKSRVSCRAHWYQLDRRSNDGGRLPQKNPLAAKSPESSHFCAKNWANEGRVLRCAPCLPSRAPAVGYADWLKCPSSPPLGGPWLRGIQPDAIALFLTVGNAMQWTEYSIGRGRGLGYFSNLLTSAVFS